MRDGCVRITGPHSPTRCSRWWSRRVATGLIRALSQVKPHRSQHEIYDTDHELTRTPWTPCATCWSTCRSRRLMTGSRPRPIPVSGITINRSGRPRPRPAGQDLRAECVVVLDDWRLPACCLGLEQQALIGAVPVTVGATPIALVRTRGTPLATVVVPVGLAMRSWRSSERPEMEWSSASSDFAD